LSIQGVPVIITDTAGLHDSIDPVETIGMEKTLEHLNGCDLVLLMVEADHAVTPADQKIYEHVHSKPKIIVYNKIDLLNGNTKITPPKDWTTIDQVSISALYDQGIDFLKEKILRAISGKNPIEIEEEIIPNLRHKQLLEMSITAVEDIVDGFESGISAELVAISIQEAVDSLGEILGENVKIDVLDRIFSQFCIGK
jgi:tRNA modification GTPase